MEAKIDELLKAAEENQKEIERSKPADAGPKESKQ